MRLALIKAIKIAGGQCALAEKLGVAQCTISAWVNRNKKAPPPEYVLQIEAMTGVSRYELRPDVFGKHGKEA